MIFSGGFLSPFIVYSNIEPIENLDAAYLKIRRWDMINLNIKETNQIIKMNRIQQPAQNDTHLST